MPNLNYLKVWGCLAKVAVPKPKKVNVGPKTTDCVFIRYAQNSNAYRFLVHKSEIPDIHVNTIIESRDASFFENIFPYNIVYESIIIIRGLEILYLEVIQWRMNLDVVKDKGLPRLLSLIS